VTNRDKRDSIRGRMADTGEPFNVARRNVGAAAAGRDPEGEDPYQLIEVEVGTDARPHGPNFPEQPPNPRHIETFRGRWVIEPDPERLYPDSYGPKGSNRSVYYGVAQTRRGRIAVYRGKGYPPITAEQIAQDPGWEGELDDYDTLADAQLPEDIKRQAAAALDIREVIHRDI
jgi:hypothetical protein